MNVFSFDDDVAKINADAKLDAVVLRHATIAFEHALLDLDRTAHCIHDAWKLR